MFTTNEVCKECNSKIIGFMKIESFYSLKWCKGCGRVIETKGQSTTYFNVERPKGTPQEYLPEVIVSWREEEVIKKTFSLHCPHCRSDS